MLVQELGHLTTRILQLGQADGTARLGGADSGSKSSDRVPRVARIEDGVVVVFEVVAVDWDVAEADDTSTAVRKL